MVKVKHSRGNQVILFDEAAHRLARAFRRFEAAKARRDEGRIRKAAAAIATALCAQAEALRAPLISRRVH